MAEKNSFDLKMFGVLWIVFLVLFEISFQITLIIALVFGLAISAILTYLVGKYRKDISAETGPSTRIFAGMMAFYLVADLIYLAFYRGFGGASLAATIIMLLVMGIIWGGVTSAVVWKLAKKR